MLDMEVDKSRQHLILIIALLLLLQLPQVQDAALPLPRHGRRRGERPARPSGAACAKRPHGRLRRLSAELENVGEASGKPPTF